ncbi:MAG: DUF4190 domain-containing protein [Nocardioidaceae bacterium]
MPENEHQTSGYPAYPQQQAYSQQPPSYPQQYPQYGQQYPHPYYAPARTTNGLAIASMVLGILWIYWIGSILALIFGYVARKQIRERNQSGDGMAIAGIVLGWIGVGVIGLLILVFAIAGTTTGSSSGY